MFANKGNVVIIDLVDSDSEPETQVAASRVKRSCPVQDVRPTKMPYNGGKEEALDDDECVISDSDDDGLVVKTDQDDDDVLVVQNDLPVVPRVSAKTEFCEESASNVQEDEYSDAAEVDEDDLDQMEDDDEAMDLDETDKGLPGDDFLVSDEDEEEQKYIPIVRLLFTEQQGRKPVLNPDGTQAYEEGVPLYEKTDKVDKNASEAKARAILESFDERTKALAMEVAALKDSPVPRVGVSRSKTEEPGQNHAFGQSVGAIEDD